MVRRFSLEGYPYRSDICFSHGMVSRVCLVRALGRESITLGLKTRSRLWGLVARVEAWLYRLLSARIFRHWSEIPDHCNTGRPSPEETLPVPGRIAYVYCYRAG